MEGDYTKYFPNVTKLRNQFDGGDEKITSVDTKIKSNLYRLNCLMSKSIIHEDTMKLLKAGMEADLDENILSVITDPSSQEMIDWYWRTYFKFSVM